MIHFCGGGVSDRTAVAAETSGAAAAAVVLLRKSVAARQPARMVAAGEEGAGADDDDLASFLRVEAGINVKFIPKTLNLLEEMSQNFLRM